MEPPRKSHPPLIVQSESRSIPRSISCYFPWVLEVAAISCDSFFLRWEDRGLKGRSERVGGSLDTSLRGLSEQTQGLSFGKRLVCYCLCSVATLSVF
jgi:hypothetical protein